MGKQIKNPLLGRGFQLITGATPPKGGAFVPALDSVVNIPDDVQFFYYDGPTIEGYTHGYFYERYEVTPAVVDVETYTIPANTRYIKINDGSKGKPTGIYYYIPDYKYVADIKERYDNRVLFFKSNCLGDDGNYYALPDGSSPVSIVKVNDIAWNAETKEEYRVTEILPRQYGGVLYKLENGVTLDISGGNGSMGRCDAYVKDSGEVVFYDEAWSGAVGVELRESLWTGQPAVYAYWPFHDYRGFEKRYTEEEITETVRTVISPAVMGWRQADTQPRDQQKTKLSEFTDDLGDEPTHTHKQYSTHDETIKSINDIIMMNEDWFSYGIEFDTTVSSPTCTRIGNMALHRDCPIQNNMRGCLLDDNGKVVKYLNPQDWRGEVRDGSQGQVMVEIPSYYAKFETVGTKRRVRLSEYALKGYFKIPVRYVSAYEAALERSTGKLASVVNLTEDYRGGNNTADWDGTYRSLLGRPATVMSRTAYRNAAKARNTSIDNWTCYLYQVNRELYWLFAVEYATLNSQADYTAQRTPEGYCQGGLGQGVDNWNWDVWTDYNNATPFVNCGFTDEYGNATGVKNYTALKADGSTQYTSPVPRYHGIENPFGHIWKWCDGINIRINPGDGLSECFVADDPSVFSDSGYTGYTYIGNEARTDGYIKDIIFVEHGELMPSVVGGSSTTYYCDYHHTNIPTATQLRGLLLGGSADYGTHCGFVFSHSYHVPSNTWTSVGSRLCFITKEQ